MAAFNARTIEAAKPGPARREISDPTLRALRLVVQPSGVKSWAVRYGIGGKKAKLTLGPYPVLSLAVARERAGEALRAVAAGVDPSAAKRAGNAPDASFASAVALYDKLYVSTLRSGTQANVGRELAAATAAWGSRALASITKPDVIALTDDAAERGDTSRNTTIKNLSAFFKWCLSRAMIGQAPTHGLRRTKEASRERVLSDDELAQVWKAAGSAGAAGTLARLLILTGCRRDEIAKLEWSEVTADTITLPAARTKTGREHKVALTDAMRAILDTLPRKGRYVLTGDKPMKVNGGHKDKIDVAIADWRFHDLRRSFSTGLARKIKTPLPVIERCLNHKLGGVLAIYQQYDYADECRAAWEAWSAHVEKLTKMPNE
jgi:integrase